MAIIRRELFTLSCDEGLVDVGSSDNRLNTVIPAGIFFLTTGDRPSAITYGWMTSTVAVCGKRLHPSLFLRFLVTLLLIDQYLTPIFGK